MCLFLVETFDTSDLCSSSSCTTLNGKRCRLWSSNVWPSDWRPIWIKMTCASILFIREASNLCGSNSTSNFFFFSFTAKSCTKTRLMDFSKYNKWFCTSYRFFRPYQKGKTALGWQSQRPRLLQQAGRSFDGQTDFAGRIALRSSIFRWLYVFLNRNCYFDKC